MLKIAPPLTLIFPILLFLLTWTVQGKETISDALLAQEQQTIEATALPEEQRKQALEWLAQARQWLHQAEAAKSDHQALEQAVREAPKRLAKIQRLLKHPEKLTRNWPTLDLFRPLEWLEIRLAEEEAALTKVQAALEQKERELAELLEAAASGGQKIAELESQLAEVDNELKPAPKTPANPLERARHLSLEARRQWLKAELERLSLRQANLAILTKLARGERDLLTLEAAERRSRTERLRQAVQLAREHQAISAASATKLALKTAQPEVRPLLAQTLDLWAELEGLINEGKNLRKRAEKIKQQLDTLQNDFDRIRQAITLAGTDEAIARLLHKRLRSLPTLSSFRRDVEIRRIRLKQAIIRRFEIEEELQRLRHLDEHIEARLAALPSDMGTAHRALIRLQLHEALQNRREAFLALQQEYTRYLSILSELDVLERQLYEWLETYRNFIQRQLLWIRYREAPRTLNEMLMPLLTALSPPALTDLGARLLQRLQDDPWIPGPMLGSVILLLLLRRWAKRDLARLAQATRSIRTDRFPNTLQALVDTCILAAPFPLLLFGLGIWLQHDEQSAHLAAGLLLASRPAAALGLLRQICRPEGLAQRHLRWLQVTREQLWRQLRWFHPWAVICAFVVGATGGLSLTAASLGLGRLLFIAFMLSASVLIWRLWHRQGPILSQLAASRPGWIVIYHSLWFPLVLAIPSALALAAAAGYYYAAFYLAEKAFRTLWFFVALMLVKDFLLRWLYITERHLRYQEILRRREELRAQKGEQASELPPVEEPEVDFGRLSEQTRRLLRIVFLFTAVAGLWMIWQDAIPALNFLERITLPMTTTKMVGGVAKEVPLTLADVVTGILLGLLTMLAAKNIPGLLEFTFLQRLPLDKGARYAWSALIQYFIAAIGIYVIFASLGVRWAQIQWLIAALSVGLGFGLQEVVANFVSGLILLFERPIRVGDVVTVGDITGTVSKIRIRATTILNWDRQELVIPNKNFITGQFINWTLSDATNRILIQVGIAYGSDVDSAMNLMMEIAEAHPEVLDDPKPMVTFENFGDDALLLILRAYLGSMDNRLSTITDLHRHIYDKFNAAGIEIAFPQRDVHLDSQRPLEIVLRHPQSTTSK